VVHGCHGTCNQRQWYTDSLFEAASIPLQ
jgi:hypothetical protein